ncbi:TetR/AcrR family transcriptional regulator [Pseudonocardia spinosispora]|uniref:TetR/AcrR family transcriptional regulator n=1 Tax=Pseudonocardia spinosispora TaxID=103441 RepID=UPI000409D592|nr:TetR/AcrR family transcriptional regulator [Pseudonocardia spinosispora]
MRRTPADVAATRAALLEAALLEFAERGVASARLADIASRAGVTRGALYHHFADRTALLDAALNEPWDAVSAPAWAVLDGPDTEGRSLETRLTAFAEHWLTALRSDDRFLALINISVQLSGALREDEEAKQIDLRGRLEWRDRLQAALASASAELADGVDPAAAANHLNAWLDGTAVQAAAHPSLLPATDTAWMIVKGLLA